MPTPRKPDPEGKGRYRGLERGRAPWKIPGHKERMSALMKARVESDKFKAHCGQLTAAERAEVIKQIKRGDKYMDIAMDWLITKWTVQSIASKEKLYRRADKVRSALIDRIP